jgi:hypothetical protein
MPGLSLAPAGRHAGSGMRPLVEWALVRRIRRRHQGDTWR